MAAFLWKIRMRPLKFLLIQQFINPSTLLRITNSRSLNKNLDSWRQLVKHTKQQNMFTSYPAASLFQPWNPIRARLLLSSDYVLNAKFHYIRGIYIRLDTWK